MNVGDLFKRLAYAELSSLYISVDGDLNQGTGVLKNTAKPAVVLAANEALLRLYSKFPLLEKDVIIQMVENYTQYWFKKKYATSQWVATDSNSVPIPYIIDDVNEDDAFQEDVIKVLAVYDQHGCAVPLNDDQRGHSVFTPQPQMLQVPRPEHGRVLSVIFQAKHPTLVMDDETQEIYLPEILEGAFTAFIAYKVFSQIGTQESTAKAAEHQATFNAICNDVESMDLVSSSISTTPVSRFHSRGWI